jgi:hypothetical protein
MGGDRSVHVGAMFVYTVLSCPVLSWRKRLRWGQLSIDDRYKQYYRARKPAR